MTGASDLRAYVRLADVRSSLDAPVVRLGALAHAALDLMGVRTLGSVEAGPPAKPRDDAFSWTLQHDRLLHDLVRTATPVASVRGHDGLVLSDEARSVAVGRPELAERAGMPVLWAASASCLLDPGAQPPAALTLTTADADLLSAAGVRATSLLAWPRPTASVVVAHRVVVAVATGGRQHLPALLEALRTGLPGRPVVDVLPDVPLTLDGRRHAPAHPWLRSRLVRSSDLVLTLGRSASTDLVAAEATLAGADVHRVVTDGADGDASVLGARLPPGWVVAPVDAAATAQVLHVPTGSLAGWLTEVSEPRDEEI